MGGKARIQRRARRLIAGRPRVQPSEEELDEPSRDLGGEQALRRGVEASDVQCAGVAQRRARGTRRERLVHVHEVERQRLEELFHDPRDVHGDRDAALGTPDRHHLAGGEEDGLAAARAPKALRLVARFAQRPPRAGGEPLRARRRDDHHAVAATRQLVRDGVDIAVQLASGVPRLGRDMGDVERHALQDRAAVAVRSHADRVDYATCGATTAT